MKRDVLAIMHFACTICVYDLSDLNRILKEGCEVIPVIAPASDSIEVLLASRRIQSQEQNPAFCVWNWLTAKSPSTIPAKCA